jgi:hypothetical protein
MPESVNRPFVPSHRASRDVCGWRRRFRRYRGECLGRLGAVGARSKPLALADDGGDLQVEVDVVKPAEELLKAAVARGGCRGCPLFELVGDEQLQVLPVTRSTAVGIL